MKFAVIAVIAGNHLVHDWWFVLHSLLLVTNGGKLCAAHCRHICCITALLPGQLSHCNLQMSTSNPLQLHLLRRVSRWNINLLTVRSWKKKVKSTNVFAPPPPPPPTLTSIEEGRFTSSILRYIPLNPSKPSLHTNICNYNHVANLASD